jgi:AraC family transcriptional regulator of adaptative response/methylated-DNA-[protein]-cysteine methyltransferase
MIEVRLWKSNDAGEHAMMLSMSQSQANFASSASQDRNTFLLEEVYWNAVETRNAALDGTLVYAVVTTGVFCKPSCRSRMPLRKNVRFFQTAQAAQLAGFRACLRCQPTASMQAGATVLAVHAACRWMEQHADSHTSYISLARHAGMGATHFHRAFKRIIGVTPKRYADGLRLQHFKTGLKHAETVTGQIYDSGFSSPAGFTNEPTAPSA